MRPDLDLQDFGALGYSGTSAITAFNKVLAKSVGYYQKHLPRSIASKLNSKVSGEDLIEICKLLAPVRLIASKRSVVQTFYMKFAKGLYKWDLAQFFTPPTVTDFIVDVLNPQFGEHIKDPACGSADFLTAAFHKRRDTDPSSADSVWGADNSKNAVQVAVLNMLLNGDGKSNIKEVDSLATVDSELNKYEILVCNPPFGVKIKEKKATTLRKFDLGHEWELDEGAKRYMRQKGLLSAQEVGILFVEACVLQAKKGEGRIGIIVPNGYLGNRSKRYRVFREWLLRNCRLAAICGFPRFTFKTSGADVSASVIYLQRREKPLSSLEKAGGYSFSVQIIENVGWDLGNKRAAPKYIRVPEDGSFRIGEDGEKVLDADFGKVLDDLRRSAAAEDFSWLTEEIVVPDGPVGWAVGMDDVLCDPDITLDPKRLCRKATQVRSDLKEVGCFPLGKVVDIIPERTTAKGKAIRAKAAALYMYVGISEMGHGDHRANEMRGWELPERARHFAESGDIYVGKIWSSVTAWCLMPTAVTDTVVTNGCHRLRVKEAKKKYLADVLAFLCTESYAIQMRSLARGSDGLAEITSDDVVKVLIPKLTANQRKAMEPYIESLLDGTPDLMSKVRALSSSGGLGYSAPPQRPSHVVLV